VLIGCGRVGILIGLFVTGFAPVVHRLVMFGPKGLETFPLAHTAATTLCYLIGTVFYVTRFPEKYIPDVFDIWVSNHSQSFYQG